MSSRIMKSLDFGLWTLAFCGGGARRITTRQFGNSGSMMGFEPQNCCNRLIISLQLHLALTLGFVMLNVDLPFGVMLGSSVSSCGIGPWFCFDGRLPVAKKEKPKNISKGESSQWHFIPSSWDRDLYPRWHGLAKTNRRIWASRWASSEPCRTFPAWSDTAAAVPNDQHFSKQWCVLKNPNSTTRLLSSICFRCLCLRRMKGCSFHET